MAQEKLLTIREAAQYLDVSEREIITLADEGKIPAYKVGGVYLRFKREQLDKARPLIAQKYGHTDQVSKATVSEKVRDFFYFNDFYIFSLIVIVVIVYFILKS